MTQFQKRLDGLESPSSGPGGLDAEALTKGLSVALTESNRKFEAAIKPLADKAQVALAAQQRKAAIGLGGAATDVKAHLQLQYSVDLSGRHVPVGGFKDYPLDSLPSSSDLAWMDSWRQDHLKAHPGKPFLMEPVLEHFIPRYMCVDVEPSQAEAIRKNWQQQLARNNSARLAPMQCFLDAHWGIGVGSVPASKALMSYVLRYAVEMSGLLCGALL